MFSNLKMYLHRKSVQETGIIFREMFCKVLSPRFGGGYGYSSPQGIGLNLKVQLYWGGMVRLHSVISPLKSYGSAD